MSLLNFFRSLNNDILQCILYEWLSVKDICQLDIAVCNHSQRPLYYEALQLSIMPIFVRDLISEKKLDALIQWSKKRGIKNPIEEIDLVNLYPLISHEAYYELSNNFKYLKYTYTLKVRSCNSLILPCLLSLPALKVLNFHYTDIPINDQPWIGFLLKHLACLETLCFTKTKFDPILLLYLSEIPSLINLSIMEYDLQSNRVSAFTRYISKLTQLRSFELSFDNYNKTNKIMLDLSFLSTFSHLIHLHLLNVKFSIEDILQLTQIEELELGFSFPKIIYDNYLPLKYLKSFTTLGKTFNYDFMQYIFRITQLTSLTIHDTCLESSSFYNINKLSCLTSLSIYNLDIDEHLFRTFVNYLN